MLVMKLPSSLPAGTCATVAPVSADQIRTTLSEPPDATWSPVESQSAAETGCVWPRRRCSGERTGMA